MSVRCQNCGMLNDSWVDDCIHCGAMMRNEPLYDDSQITTNPKNTLAVYSDKIIEWWSWKKIMITHSGHLKISGILLGICLLLSWLSDSVRGSTPFLFSVTYLLAIVYLIILGIYVLNGFLAILVQFKIAKLKFSLHGNHGFYVIYGICISFVTIFPLFFALWNFSDL